MTLQELERRVYEAFRPPSDEGVSAWADHNMIIVGKSAPEPGPWHTDRAPYQREIMDSFSERGIHDIVVMSAAQMGKTNMLMNMMGRMIDLSPGPSLLVMPAEDDGDNFSKERLAPTIEACPALSSKVYGGNGSTIRQKNFPGGFLSITGAMSPGGLKSRPIQYLFMDEVDGYPASAGIEGDPVSLARKRTQNFIFAKRVLTSTPTMKSTSRIYREFLRGTQEEWEFTCKHCGGIHQVHFDDVKFTKSETPDVNGNPEYEVESVYWKCPSCHGTMTEYEVKRAPAKWVPHNAKAIKRGVRSFHMNAFMSPWSDWKQECKRFLDSKDDPEMLKTFYNLELGLPFERKEQNTMPESIYLRREHYDAEVPDGVLVITIGIDTQENRLEYEVKGWGRDEESWGIQYGALPGRADEADVWEQVDALLDREWKMKNGKTMKAAVSFMDAGGHYWDDVIRECHKRRHKRLYAIKGDNKDTGPLVRRSRDTKGGLNLFMLNVYVGKRAVLYNAGITVPGPRYMHYPDDDSCGYDEEYFKGLISEQVLVVKKKGVYVEEWVKVYERNEPLDVCNYARCALKGFKFDLDSFERRYYGEIPIKIAPKGQKRPRGLISEGIKV